jgi:arylsulfatase A-like enzyme
VEDGQAKGFGVTAPLCGPFRDGRFSGRYRQRIGFYGNRDEFKRSGTFARSRRSGGIGWLAGRFRRGGLKADPRRSTL